MGRKGRDLETQQRPMVFPIRGQGPQSHLPHPAIPEVAPSLCPTAGQTHTRRKRPEP